MSEGDPEEWADELIDVSPKDVECIISNRDSKFVSFDEIANLAYNLVKDFVHRAGISKGGWSVIFTKGLADRITNRPILISPKEWNTGVPCVMIIISDRSALDDRFFRHEAIKTANKEGNKIHDVYVSLPQYYFHICNLVYEVYFTINPEYYQGKKFEKTLENIGGEIIDGEVSSNIN